MLRRTIALVGLVIFLMGFGQPANADPLSDSDARAIHDVVQSQLAAFAQDDAVRAFSFASPALQASIGSPDRFLDMVKRAYPPVYRNQRAIYSVPQNVAGHTLMKVRLTGIDSSVWLAVYEMEHEADGRWSISGCKLRETAAVAV